MRLAILFLAIFLLGTPASACSCIFNYEYSFFRNASQTRTCLAVCDTVYTVNLNAYSPWPNEETIGFFRVISAMQSTNVESEQYVAVLGHDGVNCGANMNAFSPGDTTFLSMSLEGDNYFIEASPTNYLNELYYLEGLCDRNYLIVEKQNNIGLSVSEVMDRLDIIWNHDSAKANCYEESWYFWDQVLPTWDEYCLVQYVDFDYSYSFEELTAQTGRVVVLDNNESNGYEIGDTLTMIGDDGLNCGESLHRLNSGDTLLVNMRAGYHEAFAADTFLLQGGCCSKQYLDIHGDEAYLSAWASLPLTEVLDILKDPPFPWTATAIGHIIQPVELSISADSTKKTGPPAKPDRPMDISFWPNPARDLLMFDSHGKDTKNLQIFDIQGAQVHQWTAQESTSIGHTNISHLPSGIYHVQLEFEGGFQARKIVKQ